MHEPTSIARSGLSKMLGLILLAAFSLVAVILGVYFYHFHGEFSKLHDHWGTFGDFIGGALNPALSFLSLIALLLTLSLQSKQTDISTQELKLSRTELMESRKELKRSAEAQIQAEINQRRQIKIEEITVRISAIRLLIEQDGGVLKEHVHGSTTISTIDIKALSGFSKRELLNELGSAYRELQLFKTDQH